MSAGQDEELLTKKLKIMQIYKLTQKDIDIEEIDAWTITAVHSSIEQEKYYVGF